MNKAQLVARIAKDSGLTKADALRSLDALLENITKALKKGDDVKLVDFGVFDVYRRRARAGRHPQSGAPLKIPARRTVRFAAGKLLRAKIQ